MVNTRFNRVGHVAPTNAQDEEPATRVMVEEDVQKDQGVELVKVWSLM